MSLKTVVKAGNITNLSDARYFAGMGVEIIGFPVGKSISQSFQPSRIKEIAGWLSGVKIALEIEEVEFEEAWLEKLLQELPLDYLQIPESLVTRVRKLSSAPLLIVTDKLIPEIEEQDCIVFTGSIPGNELLKNYCTKKPVILSGTAINVSEVLEILNTINPHGIELKGGSEISPGLKDFEELSEILELLEVEE